MNNADTDLADFLTATATGGPAIALRVVTDPRPAASDLPGVSVRRLDGREARTLPALYRALARAWDFPAHFGMNKDALDDCMGDLPDGATGYLTEVTHPALLLDRSPGQLSWFVDSIAFYADEYAPDRTFGVLLMAPTAAADATARAWTAAGADLVAVR